MIINGKDRGATGIIKQVVRSQNRVVVEGQKSGKYFEMGWKAAQKLMHHSKILGGDNVMIIGGKDRSAIGIIRRVVRSQNRVIFEGKNFCKRFLLFPIIPRVHGI